MELRRFLVLWPLWPLHIGPSKGLFQARAGEGRRVDTTVICSVMMRGGGGGGTMPFRCHTTTLLLSSPLHLVAGVKSSVVVGACHPEPLFHPILWLENTLRSYRKRERERASAWRDWKKFGADTHGDGGGVRLGAPFPRPRRRKSPSRSGFFLFLFSPGLSLQI